MGDDDGDIGAIDPVSSGSGASYTPAATATASAPASTDGEAAEDSAPPAAATPSDTITRSSEADEANHDTPEGNDHDVTRGMRELRNQPDVEQKDAADRTDKDPTAAKEDAAKPVHDGPEPAGSTRKIATPGKPAVAGTTADSSRNAVTKDSPQPSPADKALGQALKDKVARDAGEDGTIDERMPNEGPYKGWSLEGDKKNWGFQPDQSQLEAGVKESLAGAQPAPGSTSLTLPNGQSATLQTTRGADGVDQHSVTLPDGRNMNVFMNNTGLDDKGVNTALTNISDTVNRAPGSLYARSTPDGLDRQNTVDIHVDRNLGIGGTDRSVAAINGLTNAGDNPNSIHVAAPFTQNAEQLKGLLDHEAGHLFDARNGDASQSGLFGKAMPGLASKSFVSGYAGSNAREDFAESNAELLRFRDAYQANNGKDFLTLPADQQASALNRPWTFNGNGTTQQVQYPPVVNAKLKAIADIYRRQDY